MPALSTLYFSARLLHRVRERKEKQLKEWVLKITHFVLVTQGGSHESTALASYLCLQNKPHTTLRGMDNPSVIVSVISFPRAVHML